MVLTLSRLEQVDRVKVLTLEGEEREKDEETSSFDWQNYFGSGVP